MELQTINFLRAGGALAQLDERFAIRPRRHGRYPNLVLLKCSQIDRRPVFFSYSQARWVQCI